MLKLVKPHQGAAEICFYRLFFPKIRSIKFDLPFIGSGLMTHSWVCQFLRVRGEGLFWGTMWADVSDLGEHQF